MCAFFWKLETLFTFCVAPLEHQSGHIIYVQTEISLESIIKTGEPFRFKTVTVAVEDILKPE